MALLMIGIDEAGYGPLLGPLCVGMSVFRIEEWNEGDKKPCLWTLLSQGVCREARDKRGRVAFADSKALKLPNHFEGEAKRHPLTHLERGVLAAAANLGDDSFPVSDADLHAVLGAQLTGQPWYEGDAVSLPVSGSAALMGIAGNQLARALEEAGVKLLAMRCRVVNEREFNGIVASSGNKGSVCIAALADHLRFAIGLAKAHPEASVRIACDKLGGRDSYAPVLEELLPGWECRVIEQSAEMSNYEVRRPGDGEGGPTVRVSFQPEAEESHLPVALASMIAKYIRELAMHRFNRYWSARMPELKPTAGYRLDAHRWLADAAPVLTREEKAAMIRRA